MNLSTAPSTLQRYKMQVGHESFHYMSSLGRTSYVSILGDVNAQNEKLANMVKTI